MSILSFQQISQVIIRVVCTYLRFIAGVICTFFDISADIPVQRRLTIMPKGLVSIRARRISSKDIFKTSQHFSELVSDNFDLFRRPDLAPLFGN